MTEEETTQFSNLLQKAMNENGDTFCFSVTTLKGQLKVVKITVEMISMLDSIKKEEEK